MEESIDSGDVLFSPYPYILLRKLIFNAIVLSIINNDVTIKSRNSSQQTK